MPQTTYDPRRRFFISLALVFQILRFLPARMLHVGMLIVSIMSFSGPGADENANYTATEQSIVFPRTASMVQQGEIALTVLCFVLDPVLTIFLLRWGNRVTDSSYKARPDRLKLLLLLLQLPWNFIALGGWIVCIYFQASYVPIRGGGTLTLCEQQDAVQCKMVSASWILSMVFCVDHFFVILTSLGCLAALPTQRRVEEFAMRSVTPIRDDPESNPLTFNSPPPPSYQPRHSISPTFDISHQPVPKNG